MTTMELFYMKIFYRMSKTSKDYLTVEFIASKTLTEITAHFDRRLQNDPDFAKRYEKWQKITNQNSWLNLYETLNDNEEI